MTHTARQSPTPNPYLLLPILALAAFLRLYRIDLIDLRFDEASTAQWALEIARGNLQLIAPFSGSVANHPPVMLYALAVPYWFTTDVLVVGAWRALLDVAAIPIIWLACARHWNRRVAVLACLLFAIGPWAVQLARNLRPVALPLSNALLLWGLLEAMHPRTKPPDLAGLNAAPQTPRQNNRPGLEGATNDWGWPLASLGFALSAGNHLAAVYLVPVIVVALGLALVTRRLRINRITLLALLPVLILAGSYVWYDANNGWRNIAGYRRMAAEPASVSVDALRYTLWGSGGAHLSDFTGQAFGQWQAQVPTWLNGIDDAQMALLGLGLGLCVWQLLRPSARSTHTVLLLAWLLLPVLLQLRHTRPPQMHYFTLMYPVTFIVMAVGIDSVLRLVDKIGMPRTNKPGFSKKPGLFVRELARALSVGLGLVLAVIMGWQVFNSIRFYTFIDTYDTSKGGYGLPAHSSLNVVGLLRDQPDVIVVTPGADRFVNELATVFDVILGGQPHRFANAGESLILREHPAAYIFTPDTQPAYENLLRYANVSMTRTVPLRTGSGQLYTVVWTSGVNLASIQSAPAQPWQNGAQLLGYQIDKTDVLRVRTFIKVWRPVTDTMNYHWYHHLYNGEARIAQADMGGVHPSNWREGDILLHWANLPLPIDSRNARDLKLRVGCYTYPQIQTVMLVDGVGNVMDDGVNLEMTSDE